MPSQPVKPVCSELPPKPLQHGQTNPYEGVATLLDQDNQPVATGLVTLFPSLLRGSFYPHKNAIAVPGSLPEKAATLKTSDGLHCCKLTQDKKICEAKPFHLHFGYEPLIQS